MSHTETITLEETSMTGMMMMTSVELITIMVSITFDSTTTITTIIIVLMSMLVGIVEKDEVIIFMVIVSG